MADPRALGAIVHTLRERAGFEPAYCAEILWPYYGEDSRRVWFAALEDGDAYLPSERVAALVDRLVRHGSPTPAEADALHAAAGLVPPDVAVLAAAPARWAAVRDLALPLSCAVVIPRDGRFAALRSAKREGRIEIPGGKVEPGESPAVAARREVLEEVGLHVTHLVPLFVGFDGVRFRAHVYLAQAIGELRSSPEGEALWATADELLEGSFGDFYSSSPAILLALGRNPFMTMPLGARTREDGPF